MADDVESLDTELRRLHADRVRARLVAHAAVDDRPEGTRHGEFRADSIAWARELVTAHDHNAESDRLAG